MPLSREVVAQMNRLGSVTGMVFNPIPLIGMLLQREVWQRTKHFLETLCARVIGLVAPTVAKCVPAAHAGFRFCCVRMGANRSSLCRS